MLDSITTLLVTVILVTACCVNRDNRNKNNCFIEVWDRPNGKLDNGWIDPFDDHPTWWDEVKLYKGTPVIPNPDTGKILQIDNSGARAAFYQDFGKNFQNEISASIVWNGVQPYESTPLIHINPNDDDFGIGAWPVAAFKSFLIGGVGRRPDLFRVIAFIPFEHIDGKHRRIELRSSGTQFSLWISKIDNPETMFQVGEEYDIPVGLIGSSIHGGAIDLNQDENRPKYQQTILSPFKLCKLK